MVLNWNYCPICAAPLTPYKRHSHFRCDECQTTHYQNPKPVVAALIESPDGVLLAHNREWPEKMFGLITGFIEPTEDPVTAVLREVKEETGLDGSVDHLIGLYPFSHANEVIIAYCVHAHGPVTLGDELDDYRWIDPDKLKAWDFGTGYAVRDWLTSRSGKSRTHPIMDAIDLFGRRWSLRILWELSETQPQGFRELRRSCGNLSPDTLSTRLKELCSAGLLCQDPGSDSWQMTEMARQLKPHLIGLARWARHWRDEH